VWHQALEERAGRSSAGDGALTILDDLSPPTAILASTL
jgi:hypothetical protein